MLQQVLWVTFCDPEMRWRPINEWLETVWIFCLENTDTVCLLYLFKSLSSIRGFVFYHSSPQITSRGVMSGERAGHKRQLIVRSPEMLVNAHTELLACLSLHLLGERTRISSYHLNFRERREFVHCSCLKLLCPKRRWDRFFLSHW
jgi:hypothetical protein